MMNTYYYNVNSRRKVLHLEGCHYLRHSRNGAFGKKHSLEKALPQGFTFCKHCMTIQNRFVSQYQKFGASYKGHNYTYICCKEHLDIKTGKGNWKVIYSKDKPVLELYHQNKEPRVTDSLSPVPGYHYQYVQAYEFNDIIFYIYIHDGKPQNPPRKGTRKYKNMKQKNKIQSRKASIQNVLMLIDSLDNV